MRSIFTLDVGTGTQDFLLYKEGENIRNCPKMILPSPTQLVARKVRDATSKKRDIVLRGYTMGGGPCTKAIKDHIRAGLKVYAEEKAALTVSDNIEEVKKVGIEIINENEEVDAVEIKMGDVDLPFFNQILEKIEESIPETIIIAVQDHGFSPHESNRRFRFRMFEEMMKKDGYIHSFLFHSSEVPRYFNRMTSVVESIEAFGKKDVYVMDTVFAAIAGCMPDVREFPALLLNFGNSHTIGAVVDRDGYIFSLFEHHTRMMREKGTEGIEEFIKKFLSGEISNEDVFNDGGHGAFVREVVDVKDVVATGPNMHLCRYRIANPVGDVMIVGNLGMIYAFSKKKGITLDI